MDRARGHLPDGTLSALEGENTSLSGAGLSSLQLVALIADLERHLGFSFPATAIVAENFVSVATLTRVVAALLDDTATKESA